MDADPDVDATRSEADRPQNTKVSRLLEQYALAGVGDELARRWRGEQRDERQSLRELAEHFNRLLLESALERAGERPVDGEVENLYRLLIDDEVRTAARTEAETKLARLGIDVETLRRDFVSHQAIHTYLTRYRGVEPPARTGSTDTTIENRSETLQRLQHRLVAVAERTLEGLRDAGDLSLASFDVMVRVMVYCDECGSATDVIDLLGRGGCECQITES